MELSYIFFFFLGFGFYKPCNSIGLGQLLCNHVKIISQSHYVINVLLFNTI